MNLHPIDFLNQTFQSFHLAAYCTGFSQIRNIGIFDVQLAPGMRLRELKSYSDELALSLRAKTKPLFVPLPEQGIVKMEITNQGATSFNLFPILFQTTFPTGDLPFYLGNSTMGKDIFLDLVKCPHILIGGATGTGKSTLLHTIIANAIMFPNLQLDIFDTKNVEYNDYSACLPQVRLYGNYDRILARLKSISQEMEDRYRKIRIDRTQKEKIPYTLIIIDEFADLIAQDLDKELYRVLCGLAQKCRAAKIHIILATQRPSANIISGQIKANFPVRIALQTASAIDSRIVLDAAGAELLNGAGDALIRSYQHQLTRFQVPFTTPQEIQGNVKRY